MAFPPTAPATRETMKRALPLSGQAPRTAGRRIVSSVPVAAARLAVFAAALVLTPDCVGPEESTSAGDGDEETSGSGGGSSDSPSTEAAVPAGALISAAIWTLAWDTEGVVFPEGGGAEWETDLGYRVRLDQGRILSHSVAFGPCDAASSDLHFGLSVRAARAHAEGTDPSTIEASWIEDLTAPATATVDTSFAAARYCRSHYLLARPMTATKGPADVPMEQRSLFVTGTFERGGVKGEIAIDTWWPQGKLVDLDLAMEAGAFDAARASGEAHHAFVTVTRHLGHLFDGVDFEVASEDQVAGLAIDNLVRGVDFEVVLWAPGGE